LVFSFCSCLGRLATANPISLKGTAFALYWSLPDA
jgi:hypothetical protein